MPIQGIVVLSIVIIFIQLELGSCSETQGSCSTDLGMDINSVVALHDGTQMPQIGLGVYKAPAGGETELAVYTALKNGYRHIDTAEIYRNEADVGRGIKRFLDEGTVKREDLWITTKFFPQKGMGNAKVKKAIRGSLEKLQLSYVDLYLIHAPTQKDRRLEQWQAIEELKDEGLARAIGVSNYGVHHLQELLAVARHRPVVNQIELSPYNTRKELVQFCRDQQIYPEAYSPLTCAARLEDPKLVTMAGKYGVSAAQLLIRWSLQKGYISIPKSTKEERIIENSSVFHFEISPADMVTLDGFDEYFVSGWDPTVIP